MFSDMLFTAVCPLKDLQRFVVFKIIAIFVLSFLSFDYEKRITAIFEDFIKILVLILGTADSNRKPDCCFILSVAL